MAASVEIRGAPHEPSGASGAASRDGGGGGATAWSSGSASAKASGLMSNA